MTGTQALAFSARPTLVPGYGVGSDSLDGEPVGEDRVMADLIDLSGRKLEAGSVASFL